MDKMRNQRIRDIMKVDKNIFEVIEERKQRWFDTLQEGRRQNSENDFGIGW